MKRNSLFFAVLCLCGMLAASSVKGQNKFLEYTFQPSPGSTTTHATAISSGWLLPFNTGACGTNDRVVMVNKITGAIKYLPVHEGSDPSIDVYDIIQVEPNGFVCAGMANKGGDVVPFPPIIFKIDSAGKLIWQVTYKHTEFDRHYQKQSWLIACDLLIF